MIRFVLPLAALALAACSQQSGTDGSENDFASRVGGNTPSAAPNAATAPQVSRPAGKAPRMVAAPPPANVDIFAVQDVGPVEGFDLGQKAGSCSFRTQDATLLTAYAPPEPTIPGKAAVRLGDTLYRLDGTPGGFQAMKAGTSFRGEGVVMMVQPKAGGMADLIVSTNKDKTVTYSGKWVCA
jgi:hypothetical protein